VQLERQVDCDDWLDVSLTLDSITWHFGNFCEPHLVAQTEAGLYELGLNDLAVCFREAKELMLPLLPERTEADGYPNEILERKGLSALADELNRRSWDMDNLGPGKSLIYDAWISVHTPESGKGLRRLVGSGRVTGKPSPMPFSGWGSIGDHPIGTRLTPSTGPSVTAQTEVHICSRSVRRSVSTR
jgi:hypothetical protein